MENNVIELLNRFSKEDTTKYLETQRLCMEHFAKTVTNFEQKDKFYAEFDRIVEMVNKERDAMKEKR